MSHATDIAEARAAIANRRGRRSKYAAVPTVIDGQRFASKREGARYRELRLLEHAGKIGHLQLQPAFPLLVYGRLVSEYRADFSYVDLGSGELIVEDVKGMRTPVFVLKKKLVEAIYPIQIREVR